jgi:hypothetical protein
MIDAVGGQREVLVDGRFARLWPLIWAVWLPFLIPPVTTLLQTEPSLARLLATLIAVALFVAVYLWAAWHTELGGSDRPFAIWRLPGSRWIPLALLYALGFFVIAIQGSTGCPCSFTRARALAAAYRPDWRPEWLVS